MPQSFEQRLHAPIHEVSPDPRFEVRRARPHDFEAIFDLVDEVFGTKRPRARYDWLYRRNPNGLARCWITVDKETRKIVANQSYWPWPTTSSPTACFGSTDDSPRRWSSPRPMARKRRCSMPADGRRGSRAAAASRYSRRQIGGSAVPNGRNVPLRFR